MNTKIALKAVAYWNSAHENDFIWPQELVRQTPPNPSELGAYLQQGVEAIGWMGWADCRICGEELGACCITDGTWIWPKKAEHYLEHNVEFPAEFIEHARQSGWKIEEVKNRPEKWQCVAWCEHDYSFWKEWCKSRRRKDLAPLPKPPKPEVTPTYMAWADQLKTMKFPRRASRLSRIWGRKA